MDKNFNIMNHIQVTGIGFGSKAKDEKEAKGIKQGIKNGLADNNNKEND